MWREARISCAIKVSLTWFQKQFVVEFSNTLILEFRQTFYSNISTVAFKETTFKIVFFGFQPLNSI